MTIITKILVVLIIILVVCIIACLIMLRKELDNAIEIPDDVDLYNEYKAPERCVALEGYEDDETKQY